MGAKGKCVTKPKPKPAMFAKYTKNTNCPCWWDLTKNNCACCKEGTDAMQCGWPMQKYCYKKSDKGCPGVCNNAYTLSGKDSLVKMIQQALSVLGVQRLVSNAILTNGM